MFGLATQLQGTPALRLPRSPRCTCPALAANQERAPEEGPPGKLNSPNARILRGDHLRRCPSCRRSTWFRSRMHMIRWTPATWCEAPGIRSVGRIRDPVRRLQPPADGIWGLRRPWCCYPRRAHHAAPIPCATALDCAAAYGTTMACFPASPTARMPLGWSRAALGLRLRLRPTARGAALERCLFTCTSIWGVVVLGGR